MQASQEEKQLAAGQREQNVQLGGEKSGRKQKTAVGSCAEKEAVTVKKTDITKGKEALCSALGWRVLWGQGLTLQTYTMWQKKA